MMAKRLVKQKTGTVLVAALACMAIASMIVLAAIQTSLQQRRQLHRLAQMEQTRWLLDAGISHAVNLAQSGLDLPKKPLQIESDHLNGATIKFQRLETSSNEQIRVLVTAQIKGNTKVDSAQRSKEILIPINQQD